MQGISEMNLLTKILYQAINAAIEFHAALNQFN